MKTNEKKKYISTSVYIRIYIYMFITVLNEKIINLCVCFCV